MGGVCEREKERLNNRKKAVMRSNKPEYGETCDYVCMSGAWGLHEDFSRMGRRGGGMDRQDGGESSKHWGLLVEVV